MMDIRTCFGRPAFRARCDDRAPVAGWIVAVAAAATGCQATGPTAVPPPPPPVVVLESAPFALPADCDVPAGRVYRVEYVIRADGRTASIATAPEPACLAQALTSWVASFRYAPLPGDEATLMDWMLVTAKRGS